MSDSCEKPQGIVDMLSTREKNDAPSLRCAAVFSAHDVAIADFPTPAGPYIHNRRCRCDWFRRVVQAVMSSMYWVRVPSRQLDLYDSVTAES